MHITFLIGNGFDRNLGLKTTYSDFVKVYKTLKSTSPHIEAFREHIKDNEEKWSAAEEALGQYTQYLETGQSEAFSECQGDFCVHLANYLKDQQSRIHFDLEKENIKTAFTQFSTLTQPFPAEVRFQLDQVYLNHRSEKVYFDFINFNYTYTLDECLTIVKQMSGLLGSHDYSGNHFVNTVGRICHVHGTVDGEMVFGVNDESQIAKPDIFDGNELGKSFLIKKKTNELQAENTDSIANNILQSSSIIYIYGMALGITDKLWWQRICKWLAENGSRHLIIHQYDMPPKGVFQYPYQQQLLNRRRKFMQLGDLSEDQWPLVEGRIHITESNIFSGIKDLADSPENPDNAASPDTTDLVAAR